MRGKYRFRRGSLGSFKWLARILAVSILRNAQSPNNTKDRWQRQGFNLLLHHWERLERLWCLWWCRHSRVVTAAWKILKNQPKHYFGEPAVGINRDHHPIRRNERKWHFLFSEDSTFGRICWYARSRFWIHCRALVLFGVTAAATFRRQRVPQCKISWLGQFIVPIPGLFSSSILFHVVLAYNMLTSRFVTWNVVQYAWIDIGLGKMTH